MDWRTLPPLAALRAFEAAARLSSFSAAGRELNVTHAAVAQQVRALEGFVGVSLAYRDGRGIAVTDEGAALARALTEGFEGIADALGDLRAGEEDRPLRLTMTPSFASKWLMPRLGRFWAAHPDVPLSLHPDRRIVDLRREGMDLAIRFGNGNWPGLESELLTESRYTIVGTPDLVGGRRRLDRDALASLPWVIEEDWPEQFAFLRSIGLDPDALRTTRFPTEELAIAAALQGYGLHVELAALIGPELASGRLVDVHDVHTPGHGYWIVTRPGPPKPALRKLVRWLKSADRSTRQARNDS